MNYWRAGGMSVQLPCATFAARPIVSPNVGHGWLVLPADLPLLKENRGAAQVVSARAAIELIVNDPGITFDIDAVLDLERAQAWIDNLLKNMRSLTG